MHAWGACTPVAVRAEGGCTCMRDTRVHVCMWGDTYVGGVTRVHGAAAPPHAWRHPWMHTPLAHVCAHGDIRVHLHRGVCLP